MAKRLQCIITEQIAEERTTQPKLKLGRKEEGPPPPAQRSFTVWRVNDYDLAPREDHPFQLSVHAAMRSRFAVVSSR